jgi:cytochrome P450
MIAILPLKTHTDKFLWGDDAMKFNPERFSEDNISKIHPYAFVPFSGGPRICPGYKYANMSMKVFLSKFLMKYRVTTELKYDELDIQVRVTTVIKQGFMVKVERR